MATALREPTSRSSIWQQTERIPAGIDPSLGTCAVVDAVPRRTKPDPIEREIELALEPGSFDSDSDCYSFVSDLEKVADKVTRLTKSRPKRAVTLFETFLAGYYEKVR